MTWLYNHRMAVLGFTVSTAFLPFQLEGDFVPRWAVIAVGIPLVSKLDPRALSEPIWLLLGFLLFVCAISLVQSPFFLVGMNDMVFVVILSLAFLMGAGLETVDDLMAGLGYGVAATAALVSIQYFSQWSPFPVGSISPAGLFYNSEVMGEFSSLVLVWMVAKRRYVLGAAAAVALALSFSRIGLAAAVIGAVVAWRPRMRVLLPLIAAVLVAGVALLIFTKFSSSFHRVILWGATAMSFTPLGRGLGWASLAFPEEEFSHSDALQAIVELGIGGLALLLIPIAAFRGKRAGHAEHALFAAVLVEVLVSFPLHFPASGFVAAVVAGFMAGLGPDVRSLPFVRYPSDELRHVRWGDAEDGRDGFGQRLGGMVSVRSVSPKFEALRSRSTRSIGDA
jgi:hypothetical protein